MKIIQVAPKTLLEGEVVADNVHANKQLLVEKDTVLTKAVIEKINIAEVPLVVIYMRPEREITLLKPEQALKKGLQFGKMGYLSVSEVFFGYVLRRQPKNIDANLYRGITLLREGKYDLARNRFRTTLVLVRSNERITQPDDRRDYKRLRERIESYSVQCEDKLYGVKIMRRIKKFFGMGYDYPVTYTDNDDLITRVNLKDYDTSHLKPVDYITE